MNTATCPAHTAAVPFDMNAPDSLSVRFYGDIRAFLMSGRTFVMQVAHPAVGAGVWEFSTFRQDPWRRMREVLRSGRRFVLSGPEASFAEGARLRRMHRDIAGMDSRGRQYHALDPNVYGWVHMVFLDSMVSMNALYGTPLTRDQEQRLFCEWQEAGRHLGLEDRDMPATLDAYWARYEHAIATELEYNAAVAHILGGEAPPRPAVLRHVPERLWQSASEPLAGVWRKLIVGTLPPAYRAKIAAHHPWTDRDERSVERFRRVVRAAVPRLPAKLRYSSAALRAMCPV